MGTRFIARGRLAGVLATALAGGAAGALVAAQPAVAGTHYQQAERVAWSYTDSADPKLTATPGGSDVPLGAWRDGDGKHHISRVYATFDVSAFAGTKVVSATMYARETKATRCTDRAIEVWTTAVATNPTWAKPPAQQALVGTIGGAPSCPAPVTKMDMSQAVKAAVAAGDSRLGIELRLPASIEGDTAYGRWLSWYYGIQLSVGYNNPPEVPVQLYNANRPCATGTPYPYLAIRPGQEGPELSAMFRDADENERLTGSFAIWPVDRPQQRTEMSTHDTIASGWVSGVTVPAGTLADGTTYAWQARLGDGTDTSAWSATCHFIADGSAPDAAPGVTSSNYPQGETAPGGTPARFTFTANGVGDVLGYQYSWTGSFPVGGASIGDHGVPQWHDPADGPDFVRADGLGGSGTASLSPQGYGPKTLYVRSVDRAFNPSPVTEYQFYVLNTAPQVAPVGEPVPGQPLTVTFAPGPNVTGVLSYTYRVNEEDPQTVQAGPDGSASVTITPSLGSTRVSASSHSANGWDSPEGTWYVHLSDAPKITSEVYPDYYGSGEAGGGVGITGRFVVTSPMPDVVRYEYWIDWTVYGSVPAGPGGSATIEWTPESPGLHEIDVYAVDSSGRTSEWGYYFFLVSDSGTPPNASAA